MAGVSVKVDDNVVVKDAAVGDPRGKGRIAKALNAEHLNQR